MHAPGMKLGGCTWGWAIGACAGTLEHRAAPAWALLHCSAVANMTYTRPGSASGTVGGGAGTATASTTPYLDDSSRTSSSSCKGYVRVRIKIQPQKLQEAPCPLTGQIVQWEHFNAQCRVCI